MSFDSDVPRVKNSIKNFAVVGILSAQVAGCVVVYSAGMPFVYDSAKFTAGESLLDQVYQGGEHFVDSIKHTLDFYAPDGEGWPVMVFAHGGGWSSGDRKLTVGGKEVYRNIGRYFAQKGIGTAVISYRLLPGVHWSTQLHDVAAAIDWVYTNAPVHGGDTTRFFLAGHSSGAQMMARLVTDPSYLNARGVSRGSVNGVVSVSGGGFDLQDSLTYAMGADFAYLEERFDPVDDTGSWVVDASVVQHVDRYSPPMIFFVGSKEHPSFRRQAQLMIDALVEHSVPAELHEVAGATHPMMVLRMSKDGNTLTEQALRFILAE